MAPRGVGWETPSPSFGGGVTHRSGNITTPHRCPRKPHRDKVAFYLYTPHQWAGGHRLTTMSRAINTAHQSKFERRFAYRLRLCRASSAANAKKDGDLRGKRSENGTLSTCNKMATHLHRKTTDFHRSVCNLFTHMGVGLVKYSSFPWETTFSVSQACCGIAWHRTSVPPYLPQKTAPWNCDTRHTPTIIPAPSGFFVAPSKVYPVAHPWHNPWHTRGTAHTTIHKALCTSLCHVTVEWTTTLHFWEVAD